jgi:hypothetical protein
MARIGGVVAWIALAVAALIMAVFLTAALVIAGVVGAALLAVTGIAPRLRPRPSDPSLIEAHHVGGHTWVAHGWNERS